MYSVYIDIQLWIPLCKYNFKLWFIFYHSNKLVLKSSVSSSSFNLELICLFTIRKIPPEVKANVTQDHDYQFDWKSALQAVCGRALSWFKRRAPFDRWITSLKCLTTPLALNDALQTLERRAVRFSIYGFASTHKSPQQNTMVVPSSCSSPLACLMCLLAFKAVAVNCLWAKTHPWTFLFGW